MNRDVLETLLARHFPESDAAERRVVARQAGDLADAERYAVDAGVALGPDAVVEGLRDAPDDFGLVERWNWWVGALEVAHGGYDAFRVRRWAE